MWTATTLVGILPWPNCNCDGKVIHYDQLH
jgi:hypothetical protein